MYKNIEQRKGFTLIELLVVIAIIAILAAILFPVFAQARAKARQATCVSNQKQIAIAFQTYIQDYDETFPPANFTYYVNAANPTASNAWQWCLDPYVKSGFQAGQVGLQSNLSVWVCPEQSGHINLIDKAFTATNNTVAKLQASENNTKSYVANQNYLPLWGAGSTKAGSCGVYDRPCPVDSGTSPYASLSATNLAQIQTVAQTVLVAEGRGDTLNTSGNDTALHNPFNNPIYSSFNGLGGASSPDAGYLGADWGTYVSARQRHTGGSNYLFFDGHVKFFHEPGYSSLGAQDGTSNTHDSIPQEAATGIVFDQSSHPNAAGWFLESTHPLHAH